MKKHLLNKSCGTNLCVPPEEMRNIGKCGKEVAESEITADKCEVTCKLCLKLMEK